MPRLLTNARDVTIVPRWSSSRKAGRVVRKRMKRLLLVRHAHTQVREAELGLG
jgi:hypothetical protein